MFDDGIFNNNNNSHCDMKYNNDNNDYFALNYRKFVLICIFTIHAYSRI